MKVLRFFAVVMAFVVEVRVKAFQQEPEQCLTQKNQECSLLAMQTSIVKTPAFTIDMQPGSVLFRNNKGEWHLVSGTIRIANAKLIKLKTKVGGVKLSSGVYWLRWVTDRLWLASLEGQAQLMLTSNPLPSNILAGGFVNWYGLINYKNVNEQGVPRAVSLKLLKEVIPTITQHRDRTLVEKKRSRSIAQATELYHDVVQMRENDELRRKAKVEWRSFQRRKIEKEAQELFRQKYLSPIDLSHSLDEDNN